MPVWGDREITWRQILPPVLAAVAIVCVGYTVYRCRRPDRGALASKRAQFEHHMANLQNPDPSIAAPAIRQLGELGDPEAIGAIREHLKSTNPQVLGAACAALGKLGDKKCAQTLLGLLKHDSDLVVAGAAEGLGALRSREAVGALVELVDSRDVTTRLSAIAALGQIGDPAALPALRRRQREPCGGLATKIPDQLRSRLQEALRTAVEAIGSRG